MAEPEQDRGDGVESTEGDEPTPGPRGDADETTQEDAGLTGGGEHSQEEDERVGRDDDES